MLVEAIIVDVSVNKNAELGVNWAVWSNDDDSDIPLGTFQQPVGGVNLGSIAGAAIDDPHAAAIRRCCRPAPRSASAASPTPA